MMRISDSIGDRFDDRERTAQGSRTTVQRPVGSPLSMGGKARGAPQNDLRQMTSAPAPVAPPPALPSGEEQQQANANKNFQRAMNALRMAMPFVQKLLPLLDGHVATAVSNILTQQPPAPLPAPVPAATPVPLAQPITVDLTPVHDGLKRIQTDHRELRSQIAEQNTSLKRVEDHLELVREATDRNTLEQQELMEDLKSVGTKVNVVTLAVLAMLLASMLLNLILYLHIQRVLP